ncbi:very short patch repair endonuclease [Dickeya zeae]|uniref:very short patch repair endonuclease n=2 Tax=Dickeya zeae TaxID=204042 RepID=UPI000C9A1319|nr:DNA mismatch endonuclease Vsr [Dickeya zeae]AUQ23961.1 very short patch repair endonuclease [Dickeya zeae]PXW46631.1 T/G mismatch-specific endonuclease [Erwinia sp. AG740]UJR57083.1 DNA mismatch endonuclease Vsr [Dickeya zeae]
MADVHKPEIRRKNMKAIGNHDTAIELKISSILAQLGFEFRTQVKNMPGKPDFVIDEYRKVIFTHGCFWHHHNCHLFKVPATRTEFWLKKINQNVTRDKENNQKLISDGWSILLIWECAIRGRYKLSEQDISERIEEWVCAGDYSAEINISGLHHLKDQFS